MRAFFLALVLATGAGISSANAQSVVIGDDEAYEVETTTVVPYDDDDVDAVVVPRSGAVVVERRRVYRPPVYGWVEMRPANCGTFKYWDGADCVDARYYPPPGD